MSSLSAIPRKDKMTLTKHFFADHRQLLTAFYEAMSAHFGPCRWWPGETPFEVAVGAVLTQNTAWRNVEKALDRLKANGPPSPRGLLEMPQAELVEALRPSGFYRLKTARLRGLLAYMATFDGFYDHSPNQGRDLAFMQGRDTKTLRRELLAVKGIGPETADCILLYALGRPSFVVDAYTRRLLYRHGLLPENANYETMRDLFVNALPVDAALYNEYHALIVRTGGEFCKKSLPRCRACPLGPFHKNAD